MNPDVPAQAKSPKILACVLCQQRKIKCDKGAPCSNCEKIGVVCTPSIPAPSRKKRRTNRDLRERLAKCEALLQQYAPGTTTPTATTTSNNSSPIDYPTSTADSTLSPCQFTPGGETELGAAMWMPVGNLIHEDGSTKYVDNFPWATVQKQLSAMRQLLDDEELSADSEATPTQEEVNFSFSDISLLTYEDVTPPPVQIFKLWQVYLERVNPLTKLIHVPSIQPIVVEASTNHASVSQKAQALLFAIYFASAVSLTEAESIQTLGMTRDDALQKFSAGVKLALTRARFLEKYDMMVLQALVLYLLTVHGRSNRHEIWILSGILIRMAQKLGLHRDGEMLGLSPFETEMRRRLWWQIIMSDTKYAIASGFHEPLLTWNWDTKVPHNVNDADLYPNFMEPIRPRDSPTEMAFYLMLCELTRFVIENRITDYKTIANGSIQCSNATNNFNGAKRTPRSAGMYKEILAALDAKLWEIERKYIDTSVGPLHMLASRMRNNIIAEFESILTPIHDVPEWGTEIFSAEDNVFRICLVHFEHHMDLCEQIGESSFAWFFRMHFESDGILFMAGQLQNRPLGSLVDRCWVLIDRVYDYHTELWYMGKKENSRLGISILRAWRERERALIQLGLPYDIPTAISKLQTSVPMSTPSPAQPLMAPAPAPDPDWLVDQLSSYRLDPTTLLHHSHHQHF